MKRNISLWQLVGFSLTCLLGTLLHFLYDWSGANSFAALISGVNESTWEHIKLLFFPLFAFAVIQRFFFKEYKSFWCIKLRGILLGMLSVPVIYYTYNGVIGKSPDWLNISIFFICAAITFIYETKKFRKNIIRCKRPLIAFFAICFIGILFIILTFFTPHIEIFRDPISGDYGI